MSVACVTLHQKSHESIDDFGGLLKDFHQLHSFFLIIQSVIPSFNLLDIINFF